MSPGCSGAQDVAAASGNLAQCGQTFATVTGNVADRAYFATYPPRALPQCPGAPDNENIPSRIIDYLNGLPDILNLFCGENLNCCSTAQAPADVCTREGLDGCLSGFSPDIVVQLEPQSTLTQLVATTITPLPTYITQAAPQSTPQPPGNFTPTAAAQNTVKQGQLASLPTTQKPPENQGQPSPQSALQTSPGQGQPGPQPAAKNPTIYDLPKPQVGPDNTPSETQPDPSQPQANVPEFLQTEVNEPASNHPVSPLPAANSAEASQLPSATPAPVLDTNSPEQPSMQTISAGIQSFVATRVSQSGLIISGKSLAPGQVVTVNNIQLSMPNSGSSIVVGSSTVGLLGNPAQPLIQTISAGSQLFLASRISSLEYVISGQTLSPGQAITVNNVRVSLPTAGSSIVIGSSTVELNPTPVGALKTAAPDILGPSTSNLVIQGHISTTEDIITINSTPISLPTGTSDLVVGSGTIALSSQNTVSVGSQGFVVSLGSSSNLVISSQTLTPSGVITINDTPISPPISGSSILVGSSTTALSSQQTVLVSSQARKVSGGPSPDLVIGGETLSPGGVITINNYPLSLPSSGSAIMLTGSTIGLGSPKTDSSGSQARANSEASSSSLTIHGQISSPGRIITTDRTPIYLLSSGSAIVVGSNTISLGPQETLSVGSQALVISEDPSSDLVVDGETLAPGSVITVNGATVSLPTSGTGVVIDGSSTGVGGLILSALGIYPSTAVSTPTVAGNASVLGFTGDAMKSMKGETIWRKLAFSVLGAVSLGIWIY